MCRKASQPFYTFITHHPNPPKVMVKSPRARGKQPPRPRPANASGSTAGTPAANATSDGSSEGAPPNDFSSPSPMTARSTFTAPTSGPIPPYLEPPTGFMTLHPSARPLKGKNRDTAPSKPSSSITERDNPNLAIATPGSGGSVRYRRHYGSCPPVFSLPFRHSAPPGSDILHEWRSVAFILRLRRPSSTHSFPERASSEVASGFPKEYVELIFASMYKFCPTLVPTTYEAAEEYLREEKMKPKGSRDLRRLVPSICESSVPKANRDMTQRVLLSKLHQDPGEHRKAHLVSDGDADPHRRRSR